MSKHECMWRLCRKWSGGIVAQCHYVDCKETLNIMQVNSYLNALAQMLNHPCHCEEAFTARDMHSTTCPWYHLEWAFGGRSKDDILEREL